MAVTYRLAGGRTLLLAIFGVIHLVSGVQEGVARIGLTRHALEHVLYKRRQSPSGSLLTPLPNDTITDEYWETVNSAIGDIASQTRPPASLNDPAPPAPRAPWAQVYSAVVQHDSLPAASGQEDYSYVTPQPVGNTMHDDTGEVTNVGVVPYNTALGAHIMYGLSAQNTQTPPPTQQYVSQQFVAQCPMVIMQDQIRVTAPRCTDPEGSWTDPATGRTMLRWQEHAGGVLFGVDSAVAGHGTTQFATMSERFTFSSHVFSLTNCLGVERYKVEERTIKVDQMSAGAVSTMYELDGSTAREAYFYQYVLKHPNGTAAARSDMYRMDANQVNFSIIREGVPAETITSASRIGSWRRGEWRTCDNITRGWSITFPAEDIAFETVATVQDLRVATAAVVTLLAYRNEEVSNDGFIHKGQGHTYWQLFETMIVIFIIVLAVGLLGMACIKRGYQNKLKKFFYRVEVALLPRISATERLPTVGTTY